MTIQGAMNELVNLLNADDIPIYYKGGIKKVIETIDDYIDGKDDYIKRNTEPSNSEKSNNCEVKNYCDDCLYTDTCDSKEFFYACTSKATISKMEQVDKDINVRSKDEPRTERMNTHDYCDICNHKGCGNCIANNLDDYCVPSGYEPITQTETQNSNLTFEKRTMRDCYNCKRYETEGECIECHYEPKDEPQTNADQHIQSVESVESVGSNLEPFRVDELQTERSE